MNIQKILQIIALILFILTSCSAVPESIEFNTSESDKTLTPMVQASSISTDNPLVRQAKDDLASRLAIPVAEISMISFDEVTWPDGSLGCPNPDMKYTQVPVDGARIILTVGEHHYKYHSGGNRAPFLCKPSQAFPTLKKTPIELDLEKIIPPPEDQK
jgi:hypothetical protein